MTHLAERDMVRLSTFFRNLSPCKRRTPCVKRSGWASRFVLFVSLLTSSGLAAAPDGPAAALAPMVCAPDGTQASGAKYRICMPASPGTATCSSTRTATWRRTSRLASPRTSYIWRHLYPGCGQSARLRLRHDQLQRQRVGRQAGVARPGGPGEHLQGTTSDAQTRDTRRRIGGRADHHPGDRAVSDVFNGGLAACGPIGDFRQHTNYVPTSGQCSITSFPA